MSSPAKKSAVNAVKQLTKWSRAERNRKKREKERKPDKRDIQNTRLPPMLNINSVWSLLPV